MEGGDDYGGEMVRILLTRLSKLAFLLWDNLPDTVRSDYFAVKEKLEWRLDRDRLWTISGPAFPIMSVHLARACR